MTHDYKRHGTTTLIAAPNVLDGQVIGQCQQRHTHPAVQQWLQKHPRFNMHLTPTPASLLKYG